LNARDVIMPRSRIEATIPAGAKERAELRHDRSSPALEPGAHGDVDLVRDRLLQIAALAEAGRLTTARAFCANLLFDFQPLIAARLDLLNRTLSLLERCEGTGLRQRLLIAVHGDNPRGSRSGRESNCGSETMRGNSPTKYNWRLGSCLEVPPV
jgi:hypothetical protein